jgi:hypothetical protein
MEGRASLLFLPTGHVQRAGPLGTVYGAGGPSTLPITFPPSPKMLAMLLSNSVSVMNVGITCWCRVTVMHEDLNELLTKAM